MIGHVNRESYNRMVNILVLLLVKMASRRNENGVRHLHLRRLSHQTTTMTMKIPTVIQDTHTTMRMMTCIIELTAL